MANAKKRTTFAKLNRQNLFALAYRTNAMKTPEGRARKIETLVAMLARSETLAPLPASKTAKKKGPTKKKPSPRS